MGNGNVNLSEIYLDIISNSDADCFGDGVLKKRKADGILNEQAIYGCRKRKTGRPV